MVVPLGLAFTFVALFAVIFGLSGDRTPAPAWTLLIPFAMLVGSLALGARLQFRGTRVIEIGKETITFDQVALAFIEAVEVGRREYEQQMKQWLGRHSRTSNLTDPS